VAGGMWSITLTDIIQFCIMTVGIFFLLLPIAIVRAGGFSGMRETLPASYFDLTAIGWQTIFTYFLLFFFGLMIGQDIWQRVFTARSPQIARWGSVAAGVYCVLYALAGALVGTAARVILPDLATPDNAFARIATEALPIGITGLVLAAALAAVMSTASAGLLASSTILANDVYAGFLARRDHDKVLVSRVATLLVGVATLVTSIPGERRGRRSHGRLRPPERGAAPGRARPRVLDGPQRACRRRASGDDRLTRAQRRQSRNSSAASACPHCCARDLAA